MPYPHVPSPNHPHFPIPPHPARPAPVSFSPISGSPALLMKGSRLGGVQHPLPQQVKVRSPVHRALRRF